MYEVRVTFFTEESMGLIDELYDYISKKFDTEEIAIIAEANEEKQC